MMVFSSAKDISTRGWIPIRRAVLICARTPGRADSQRASGEAHHRKLRWRSMKTHGFELALLDFRVLQPLPSDTLFRTRTFQNCMSK